MRLGQDVLSDLAASLAREWLLSNGCGGSSSGTAAGSGALRSHAWLVAGASGVPRVLLLGTAERVRTPAGTFDLAGPAARAGAALTPESFELDPFPVWTWEAGGTRLERGVFVITGHDAVAIRYRHLGGPPATITVSPLVVSRALDGLQAQDPAFRGASQAVPGRIRIELPEPAGSLTLFHNGAFLPARLWRPVEHPGEPEKFRREEACVPGYVEATISDGASLVLVAATREDLFRALAAGDRLGSPPPRTLAEVCALLERREREERTRWVDAALIGADLTAHQARVAHAGTESEPVSRATLLDRGDGWTAPLARILLAGLARRGGRLTLVSSLPGAAERGAEALRALPGLLALRAFEPVREILRGYVEYLNEGLAPESWAADGTPLYGDPRPALWLVNAAELYARRSGDLPFAKTVLLPSCESVIQFYRAGTHYGVGVQEDGLLAAGEGGVRELEANALWSHALIATAQMARALDRRESAAFHLAWARDHQARFLEAFWDAKRGAPHARIAGGTAEPGLVPEALLAASLPPPLLPAEMLQALVATLERTLLTPWGLRDAERSTRVLPAWLGPFATAYLRAHGRDAASLTRVAGWFENLRALAPEGGLAIPEAFEVARGKGATPVRAGDPLSIMAAAELVRAWVEDLDHAGEPALAAAAPPKAPAAG